MRSLAKSLMLMGMSLAFDTFPDMRKEYSGRIREKPRGQEGPVIDSTKESKRARRRRLAREGGNADG